MNRQLSTILVTGGAGFIGSHLVEALVARGERVRVLDDFSTGWRENLAGVAHRIELVEGDVAHLPTVQAAMEGVDHVLHQAALPSVPRSIEDPAATHRANVQGTLNVLLAAKEAGVKRVVYASSSSVYGDSPQLPKRETIPPRPLSPYAASKVAAEEYCRVFAHVYGLPTVILRYFNIFGPRQDPTSQYAAVIPKFITAMLRGKRPVIYGDGRQCRDFTYVDNVVRANLLACQDGIPSGEVFNVACGRRHTVLELVEVLNHILGTEIEPRFAAPRPGDVRHSLASLTKAEEVLGYRVVVDFLAGLQRTVEWYTAQDLPPQALWKTARRRDKNAT